MSKPKYNGSDPHLWLLLDYFDNISEDTTVSEWLSRKEVEERHLEQYPNARAAQKIKDSKLYKVLR